MKTAKSYNLLILFAVFAISLICAFSTVGIASVSAANDPNGFFKTSRSDLTFSYLTDNTIGAQVADGDTVSFVNQLIVDDLGLQLYIADGLNVKVELTAKSFDANGNKFEDDGAVAFVTDVVTDFNVASKGDVTLTFGVENNFITIKENDGAVTKKTQSHYKVENVDKTPVTVKFVFSKADQSSATDLYDFKLKAVNQKASEGYTSSNKFLQTFENTNGTLNNIAIPRAVIDKNFYSNTENGYEINKISGTLYSTSVNGYSFTDKPSSTSFYLTAGDVLDQDGHSMSFPMETNPKSITFYLKQGKQTSQMTFNVCRKIDGAEVLLETYTANVISRSTVDNDAPKYRNVVDVADLVDSFQEKINNETLDPESVKNGTPHSINLGKSINVPSLENFIIDDISSYSKLTKTYHYITPSQEEKTTTSTKSIALDDAGVYRLYVTFVDENGNDTDSQLFYNVTALGEKYAVKIDGKMEVYDSTNPDHVEIYNNADYAIFIFSFTINDDAPLSVVAVDSQENGYIGVKYTALDFNIVASGFNVNYTLWYNSSLTADENSTWVQIPAINKAGGVGANGYTYEQLKSINYDGKLTFVPDKVGSYKIECNLSSDKSFRYEDDLTIVRITDEPVVVKPISTWLQDNLVSVIFLGVGTACLIAIVVLLFIKPKDKVEEDE